MTRAARLRLRIEMTQDAALVRGLNPPAMAPQPLELDLQLSQFLQSRTNVPDVRIQQLIDRRAVLLWMLDEGEQYSHFIKGHV